MVTWRVAKLGFRTDESLDLFVQRGPTVRPRVPRAIEIESLARLMIAWRMPADGAPYQASSRRAEGAVPTLLGVGALFFAALRLVGQHPADDRLMAAFLAFAGAVVLGLERET